MSNSVISHLSEYIYGSLIKNREAVFGFSILYILLYHSGFTPLFGRGYIGVDLFLFLSAFGCSFSLKKYTLLQFYLRCLNRVYPLFVISNLLKWCIGRYNGERLGVWDSVCDISGLTFWGMGGRHLLWFIPSLILLYIFTPPLYRMFNKFGNKSFCVVAILSFLVMMLFRNMDWHYACLVSRIPVFSLGLLYFIHKGNIQKLSFPLLLCVGLQELTVANGLKFATATFYAPVLLLSLCFILDNLLQPRIVKFLCWFGSKSLECFIGNGMVTTLVFTASPFQRGAYYILANIVWIFVFVWINKILPANKKAI